GLGEDRVGEVAGLGGEAEAEHVEGEDAVAGDEAGPDRRPVPGGGREAVYEEDGLAGALDAEEDAMAAPVEEVAARAPVVGGDGRSGRGRCGAGRGAHGARVDHVRGVSNASEARPEEIVERSVRW